MIYITNSTQSQVIYVPASEKKVEGAVTFTLKSTVNRNDNALCFIIFQGLL